MELGLGTPPRHSLLEGRREFREVVHVQFPKGGSVIQVCRPSIRSNLESCFKGFGKRIWHPGQ